MTRRFLIGVAPVAAVFALAASPALAGTQGCKTPPPCTSAVCVYVEQGPAPAAGSCDKKSHPTRTGGQSSTPVPPAVAPSPGATKTLKHTKPKIRKLIHRLVTSPGLGATKPLKITRAAVHVKAPSTLGAAFDLGSGPTMLFAALLAAAILLALGGGLRQRKR